MYLLVCKFIWKCYTSYMKHNAQETELLKHWNLRLNAHAEHKIQKQTLEHENSNNIYRKIINTRFTLFIIWKKIYQILINCIKHAKFELKKKTPIAYNKISIENYLSYNLIILYKISIIFLYILNYARNFNNFCVTT